MQDRRLGTILPESPIRNGPAHIIRSCAKKPNKKQLPIVRIRVQNMTTAPLLVLLSYSRLRGYGGGLVPFWFRFIVFGTGGETVSFLACLTPLASVVGCHGPPSPSPAFFHNGT